MMAGDQHRSVAIPFRGCQGKPLKVRQSRRTGDYPALRARARERPYVHRHTAFGATLALALIITGCGQRGSPDQASGAVDAFLGALVAGDSATAWEHLSPTTRDALYGNAITSFQEDVERTDLSGMQWHFGPVSDYDTSWAVRVDFNRGAAPSFLLTREIAARWLDDGVLLLVQFENDGDYLIAGQGLDVGL